MRVLVLSNVPNFKKKFLKNLRIPNIVFQILVALMSVQVNGARDAIK